MRKWLRTALIILFSTVFLVSAFMVARYYINSHKQNTQFETLSEMVSNKRPTRPPIPVATTPPAPSDDIDAVTEPAAELPTEPLETQPPQPLPEYIEVSSLNSHMIGWLQIEGTKIDYPVMHTPDDPEYYLHKDFYHKRSSHGCLFIEETCDADRPSDNITIYGHNMKDGSMFAPLNNYRSKSYWENHRYIYFDTLTERHTYEIFAVFTTKATKGSGFAYHQFVDAASPGRYDDFIRDCLDISLYDTGIIPVYGDKLITLSTCEYSQRNGRLVVVAKRVV